MMKYLAFLPLLAATACVSGPASNSCDGWRPIRPAATDISAASDTLVRQIVEHNEHGRRVCGWKRKGK